MTSISFIGLFFIASFLLERGTLPQFKYVNEETCLETMSPCRVETQNVGILLERYPGR